MTPIHLQIITDEDYSSWFLVIVCLVGVFGQEDSEPVDRSKPRCPDDPMNVRQFVRKSNTFHNPLDCCDS